MLGAATATITQLHRRTATSIVADTSVRKRWIDEPLGLVRRLNATRPAATRYDEALDRLAAELHHALAGRELAVSWIHGDFVPGNILVTPDGSMLTGIVDWELAARNELPLLDLIQLFLASRMLVQRRELGDIMRGLLHGDEWTQHERALIDAAQTALPGETVDMRAMRLLCWLRHIGANLTKSTRYGRHSLWISKNIDGVLLYVYM